MRVYQAKTGVDDFLNILNVINKAFGKIMFLIRYITNFAENIITRNIFSGYSGITILELGNNQISNIENGSFYATNLTHLSLNGNQLKKS